MVVDCLVCVSVVVDFEVHVPESNFMCTDLLLLNVALVQQHFVVEHSVSVVVQFVFSIV